MPDAVVVGAGPNGLVAANVLAERGWSVTVLEAQPEPGGGVRSGEVVEPGFVSDRFSAFYPLTVASPAMRRLQLERWGVEWAHAPYAVAHPGEDGACPALARGLVGTGLGDDLPRWEALLEPWLRLEPAVLRLLLEPFPPVRGALGTARRVRRGEIGDLARLAVLPVRRLGEESLGSEASRRLLAAIALHADLGPEQALSGLFGLLLAGLAVTHGWPAVRGGASNLTAALVARLAHHGGEVRCGTEVTEVVVRGGQAVAVRTAAGDEVEATRAVLADTSVPALFGRLLRPDDVPQRTRRRLLGWQADTATVKVDWALDGPIPWKAEAAGQAGTVHLADGVDALTRVMAQLACGEVPERPFVVLGQYASLDPTRAPAGREVAWAYTHVPQGTTTSRSEVERTADRMESEVERLAPGFGDLIRGRVALGPADLEAQDSNLVGGAIGGGTSALHQQLVFRPLPGLARPETGIGRLYLASAGAHPGGGVHGACGANAARAALLHHRAAVLTRRRTRA